MYKLIVLLMLFASSVFSQGFTGWTSGSYAKLSRDNTFTGANTFSGAVTFSGTVTFSSTITGNLTVLGGAAGESVFNEGSVDADFRIESDGDVNAFFVEGSTGRVGIGTNTLNEIFTIHATSRPYMQFTSNTTGQTSADGIFFGFVNAEGSFQIRNKETAQSIAFWTEDINAFSIVSNQDIAIGVSTAIDQQLPGLIITGDAESNNATPVSEALTIRLTQNADPTLATWGFTSTQGAGYTFDKTVLISSLTASEILITDANKNLVSAAVATYPSLAELIHVKGVTSAIQTQIDAQEAELTNSAGLLAALDDETGTGVAVFGTSPTFTTSIIMGNADIGEAELEIIDGATLTTTEINYVTGVTSAIQTQMNLKAPLASPALTGSPTLGNVIRKHVALSGATDNVATNFFTITTTDETGSTDGGAYSVNVHLMANEAGAASGAVNTASVSLVANWTRIMASAGTGANSTVVEASESASANEGTGAISVVTLTVVETSEFIQTIQLLVNTSGGTFDGFALVELVYSDFTTAPVIAGI